MEHLNRPKSSEYTRHALERGLERIMEIEAPYNQKQLGSMRKFLMKTIKWHPIKMCWVVEDFNVDLVYENGAVVTIIHGKSPTSEREQMPVRDYEKLFSKKLSKQARDIKFKARKDD